MRSPSPFPLGAFYFTSFAVLGVQLPYFNLYLESLGFDGLQIGILAAAIPLGKVVFGPIWTLWADRIGARKGMAVLSVALAAVAFSLLFGSTRFLAICAVLYLYSALLSPLLPLVEATTLELADRHRWQYGRIRVWGSVGFVVTALALGPFFDSFAIRYVLHAILAASLINLVATAAIPSVPPRATWGRRDLSVSLLRPGVMLFFGCTLLMQASHGGYYAFFSIVLDGAGYSRGTIGGLWALGVAAEMVAMVASTALLRRFGVASLMTGCLGLAVVRWGLNAATSWLPALLVAQLLHAFTFGAFHVAAVTGTHRLFPESLRSSGQSLYSGLTYGAGNALGFLGAGAIYKWGGPGPMFLAAAGMALAAAFLSLGLWRETSLRLPEAVAASASGCGGLE